MKKVTMLIAKFRNFCLTLRIRIMLTFLAIILFSLFSIAYIAVSISSEVVKNITGNQTLQNLKQMQRNIQYQMKAIENISDTIFMNGELQKDFKKYNLLDDPAFNYSNILRANDILLNLNNSNIYIQSISIIADKGIELQVGEAKKISISDLENRDWYNRVCDLNGKGVWIETRINNDLFSSDKIGLSHVRLLKNFANNGRIGILIINVRNTIFEDILKSEKPNYTGDFLVLNENGKILYSKDSNSITKITNDGFLINSIEGKNEGNAIDKSKKKNRLISYITFNDVPWKLVEVINIGILTAETSKIKNATILFAVINFIIAMFLQLKFSEIYLRPINRLSRFMNNVDNSSNFKQRFDVKGEDEVAKLAKSFNIMLGRIESLIENIYIEQEKKKVAEIKALQAQITPHFLYNTLNSINCIAKINNQEDISNMVVSLSKLLRLSIGKGEKFIIIKDEIEYLKCYLLLQNLRNRKKIEAELDIPEEIYGYKTVKLLLQPIVENSIKHGFEYGKKNGIIKISCRKEDNTIIFEITDNGTGMPDEQLDELNEKLKQMGPDTDNTEGIGIRNINERIKLHFGSDYGLQYLHAEPSGIKVLVQIPAFI